MTTLHFTTIIVSVYTVYYLVIILLDKYKQNKMPETISGNKQHVDFTALHEQPKRATIQSETDSIVDGEKKNSSDGQPYQATQDKISQEDVTKDLWHDLGLETIEVDGIEVTDKNILELIYNTV